MIGPATKYISISHFPLGPTLPRNSHWDAPRIRSQVQAETSTRPTSPELSMREAMLKASPQTSRAHLRLPTTPATGCYRKNQFHNSYSNTQHSDDTSQSFRFQVKSSIPNSVETASTHHPAFLALKRRAGPSKSIMRTGQARFQDETGQHLLSVV